MSRRNAEADYLMRRAATTRRSRSGDDRCHQSKLHADAELRGKIGSKRANEIIGRIDRIKAQR